MMNQYSNRSVGLGNRHGRDLGILNRAPYRRPMNRGSLPVNATPSVGGCGCGLTGKATPMPPTAISHETPARRDACGAVPMTNGRDSGCGFGHDRERTACRKLMDQIRAVDFALYETVLYLDVYPHSCDALETYHKLKAQQTELYREYEALCGPLTAFGNESHTSWDWMSKPFPWEYDAD